MGRNDSQCDCPPPCNNVDYDATVSTSHISDLLIDSLLTGKAAGKDIRSRYLRAREVHARVNDGDGTKGMVVDRLELLVSQLKEMRAVIDVDLLNGSTTVVGLLFNAVDAIVRLTAEASVALRREVFEPSTGTGGCWTLLSKSLQQFMQSAEKVAKSVTSISEDEGEFNRIFAASVIGLNLARNSRDFAVLPALLNDTNDMCKQVRYVKMASAVALTDDRCDETEFCNKLWRILSTQLNNLVKLSTFALNPYNSSDLVEWLQQLADGNVSALNQNTMDREALEDFADEVRNGNKEFKELFRTLEVRQCDSKIDSWMNEVKTWLNKVLSSNVSDRESFLLKTKSIVTTVTSLDSYLPALAHLISGFNLGTITKVLNFLYRDA
jgi:hypothetical protein